NIGVTVRVAEYYIKKMEDTQDKPLKTDLIKKIEVRSIDNGEDGGRVSIFVKSAGVLSPESDTAEYRYFEGETQETLSNYMAKFDTGQKNAPYYTPLLISANAITISPNIQVILR